MHRSPPLFLALALLLLTGALDAAEDTVALALWAFGDGTIDGSKARPGQTILAGQEIRAADDRPLRVLLNDAPGSTVIVGAGSSVRFLVLDLGKDRGSDLVLDVDAGVVQVDLANRGPWREFRVHGGAMDVHVVGTLFMFERVRRDQDYLAMVHGRVHVNLIAAIAKTLGQDPQIDLEGAHGVSASPSGFAAIDTLNGRAQIAAAAAARVSLQTQSLEGSGGWDHDAALALTGGSGGGDVLPGRTVDITGMPAAPAAGGARPDLAPLLDPVTSAVTRSLGQTVVEGVIQQTVQQVIDNVSSAHGSHAPLPGPPPHP